MSSTKGLFARAAKPAVTAPKVIPAHFTQRARSWSKEQKTATRADRLFPTTKG